MLNYSNSTSCSIILNILSTIIETLSIISYSILLCFIIYRLINYNSHQPKSKINILIILSTSVFCLHIIKGILQLVNINFKTLKRDFDLHLIQDDTFSCRFSSYIFFSIVNAIYYSYVLQAIFRFTRFSYPRSLWLHQYRMYIYVFIPCQIFVSFISILPLLLIFNSIRLVHDEVYCSISMEEFLPLIYFFTVIICIPLFIILLFDVYLLRKLRLTLTNVHVQHGHPRNYIVIRRIALVSIIGLTSFPPLMGLLFLGLNARIGSVIYRIQWLSSSLLSVICIISLPFVNPQLCEFLRQEHHYQPCET